jgi:hypothetical protein
LCGRRLILGPDAASLLITTILIVGPITIFCYQIKSKFYHSQERTTWQHHMRLAAVLIVILTTITASIQNGAIACHCISFTSIFVISIVFPSNRHGFNDDFDFSLNIWNHDQPELPRLDIPTVASAYHSTIWPLMQDLAFLFMTSARDPGIVPRNTRVPPEADEFLGCNTPSMDWSSGRTPRMRFCQTKVVVVNGFTVKVKFCETCLRFRPP